MKRFTRTNTVALKRLAHIGIPITITIASRVSNTNQGATPAGPVHDGGGDGGGHDGERGGQGSAGPAGRHSNARGEHEPEPAADVLVRRGLAAPFGLLLLPLDGRNLLVRRTRPDPACSATG